MLPQVYWRFNWAGRVNKNFQSNITIFTEKFQFMGGKLTMSIDMLLMIEKNSANATDLQLNFAVTDECGIAS